MKKLAIVSTHPIQYYAPAFRLLQERGRVDLKVFYTWGREASTYDKDFARTIQWDIPLLEGYPYEFVSDAGHHHTGFFEVKSPRLIPAIEEWGADAVLVFGWNYLSHLRVLLHFKGRIPVLFRGDSTLLDDKPGLRKWLRYVFLGWVYRHVDIALYVGKNSKEYFSACGMKTDQLVFAPHAIDNTRFQDNKGIYTEEARSLRRELGVGEEDILFTFVGKFQAKKAPLFLVRAFQHIRDPRAHLLMVGNGELEQQLKEISAGNANIHFLPFQNQSRMPVVYRIGDVFCLPSGGPGETWGLAVNEAMACGKPVLVSDRCGCAPDLVANGKNGFIFVSGDQQDLLDKLNFFLTQKDAVATMGSTSLETIRAWSYEQMIRPIENVMENRYAR